MNTCGAEWVVSERILLKNSHSAPQVFVIVFCRANLLFEPRDGITPYALT
jgi:hypothetical protein